MATEIRWCGVCATDTERRPKGQCRPCHNRRERDRARANPEPARQRAARWYADNRDRAKATNAQRYIENRDRVAELGRQWRLNNPEQAAARHRAYYESHPDYNRERSARRRRNDDGYKAVVREGVRRYRARKRGNQVIAYRDKDIFDRDGWVCHLCSQPIDSTLRRNNRMGASIDHLVPISRGGADQPTNVAAAHLTCNQRRNNRPLS